jgi:hypothetical protein
MKVQSSRQRIPSSESLLRQLNLYALGATAAGVGVLSLAQGAEAKIVYRSTHAVLIRGSLAIDLNADGVVDFVLLDKYHRNGQTTNSFWLYANPARKGNAVAGIPGRYFRSAYALQHGSEIGTKEKFNGNLMVFACSFMSNTDCMVGNWFDVKDRYLGLKFKIHGETHYGWARLSVQFVLNKGIVAKLTGYAYETVPNKPIIAGKTKGPDVITMPAGSLGELARGRK